MRNDWRLVKKLSFLIQLCPETSQKTDIPYTAKEWPMSAKE